MSNRTAKKDREAPMRMIGLRVNDEKFDRIDAERRKEKRGSLAEMTNVLLDEALDARQLQPAGSK